MSFGLFGGAFGSTRPDAASEMGLLQCLCVASGCQRGCPASRNGGCTVIRRESSCISRFVISARRNVRLEDHSRSVALMLFLEFSCPCRERQIVPRMSFMQPTTRYTRSGRVHIAYQVIGRKAPDLVLVPGWVSNIDAFWDHPSMVRFLNRLASFSRLMLFDKRGTGLSDRLNDSELPTLE